MTAEPLRKTGSGTIRNRNNGIFPQPVPPCRKLLLKRKAASAAPKSCKPSSHPPFERRRRGGATLYLLSLKRDDELRVSAERPWAAVGLWLEPGTENCPRPSVVTPWRIEGLLSLHVQGRRRQFAGTGAERSLTPGGIHAQAVFGSGCGLWNRCERKGTGGG